MIDCRPEVGNGVKEAIQRKFNTPFLFSLSTAIPLFKEVIYPQILPHGGLWRLMDEVWVDHTNNTAIAIAHLEPELYAGHFPNNPVFPGNFYPEICAHTGGVLILSSPQAQTMEAGYVYHRSNTMEDRNIGNPRAPVTCYVRWAPVSRSGLYILECAVYQETTVLALGSVKGIANKKDKNERLVIPYKNNQ